MKKKLIGVTLLSIIGLGAWYYYKYKKQKDIVIQANNVAIQKQKQVDFVNAVQQQATQMNSDLINENNAKDLLTKYDDLAKRKLAYALIRPNLKENDTVLVSYKNELSAIEKAINDLGYRLESGGGRTNSIIIKK